MVYLDLNVELFSLDGKKIEGTSIAKTLAEKLFKSQKGDALKYLDWALKLYSEGSITVDKADYETLLDLVKKDETVFIGYRAQIIKKLISEELKSKE